MKNLRTSKKFKIYKTVKRELSTLFPSAFPHAGKRPPLKVGIIEDLKDVTHLESSITDCRIFLRIWTSSTAYLKSMADGSKRVGLYGERYDDVLNSHVAGAKTELQTRINRRTR